MTLRGPMAGLLCGLLLAGCENPAAPPPERRSGSLLRTLEIGLRAPDFLKAADACEQACETEADDSDVSRGRITAWLDRDKWLCECKFVNEFIWACDPEGAWDGPKWPDELCSLASEDESTEARQRSIPRVSAAAPTVAATTRALNTKSNNSTLSSPSAQ